MEAIFFLPGLAMLAFGIWTAVDAGKYPDEAFRAIGTSKSTWQVWPVVLGFLCGIGALIMGIIWFTSKKAAVEQAAGGGGGYGMPPQGGYGGPPQGGWTPPPSPPPPDPESPSGPPTS